MNTNPSDTTRLVWDHFLQSKERASALELCDEKRRLDRESRKAMAELTQPERGRWNGRGGIG